MRSRVLPALQAFLRSRYFPLIFFALGAGILILPAYLAQEPRIIGGGELGGWLWRFWWMKLELVALSLKFPDQPLERFFYMLSLGRFPETGNIADLWAMSLPLDVLFGEPHHYNIKVYIIFLSNALASYAYLHYLTRRSGVAMIGAITFACNTFVFYEVQRSGLRQAVLCFIPLFALFLDRLLKERRLWQGLAVGMTFVAIAVFYWFFALFTAAFGVLRLLHHLISERRTASSRSLLLPLLLAGVTAVVLTPPFMMPYLSEKYQDVTTAALPEVSWFENFPSLKELQNPPLRPDTPYANLLASLARVLYSSWTMEWVFNPLQDWVVPLVMVLFGVILGIFRWKRTAFWLLFFLLFYSLTWGPYLRVGKDFIMVFDQAVRGPYWYAFKFVPMMSRLFAPYRMGSMVVFALSVLLALNLAALSARLDGRPKLRFVLGTLFVAAYLGQFSVDPMRWFGMGSNQNLPLKASDIRVPPWYYKLAQERGRLGIVELPLERQQDLLYYYQVVHAKKIWGGGWANPGALPPILRFDKRAPKVTQLLQFLAMPDFLDSNQFSMAIRKLNLMPYYFPEFSQMDLAKVRAAGYRYVVLHELGCFLQEPRWGKELYQRMKSQLEGRLGKAVTEFVEFAPTADSEEVVPYQVGMPWVPSIYSPLLIPEPRPFPLRMVVFPIPEVVKASEKADSSKLGLEGAKPPAGKAGQAPTDKAAPTEKAGQVTSTAPSKPTASPTPAPGTPGPAGAATPPPARAPATSSPATSSPATSSPATSSPATSSPATSSPAGGKPLATPAPGR